MERGSRAAGSGEEVEGADEEGGRLTEGGRGESREDSGYPSTETKWCSSLQSISQTAPCSRGNGLIRI